MKSVNLIFLLLTLPLLFSCNKLSDRYEKKGDSCLKNNQLKESIDYFSKAIRLNKRNITALHSLGRIYDDLGENENAIKYYTLALEVDPSYALAYRSRGYIKYKLIDYSGAIDDYAKSLELDSLNSTAYSNSAAIYEKLNILDKARLYYYKAIKLDPNHFGDMASLADIEFDLKNYDSCFKFCRRVIGNLTENTDSPYGTLGLYYIANEKWDSAVVNLTIAIKLKPNWSHYYINRGYALAGLKKYSLSIIDFNKAIELDSLNSSSFVNRADSYYWLKEYQNAIKDYSKAIALSLKYNENPGICYHNRAFAKRAIGDIKGWETDKELAKESGYPDNYKQFVVHDYNITNLKK